MKSIQLRLLNDIVVLGLKLSLTMLAPVLMSIYIARLVAAQGPNTFSSYSIVTFANTAFFVVTSSVLQVLYFLGGRALGQENHHVYRHTIHTGFSGAVLMGIVTGLIGLFAGPIANGLGFNSEVVAAVQWFGPFTAIGTIPALLFVVYRVHASLNHMSGRIASIAIIGSIVAGLSGKSIAALSRQDSIFIVSSILAMMAIVSWLMVFAAWLSLPSIKRPFSTTTSIQQAETVKSTWREFWRYGWPIGVVVLMDSSFRLSSTLAMGRWWIESVPLHSAVVLWLAAGLIIPLGISQAAAQTVSIENARGNFMHRNAARRWCIGIRCVLWVSGRATLLNVFAAEAGSLVLGNSAFLEPQLTKLKQFVLPGSIALVSGKG